MAEPRTPHPNSLANLRPPWKPGERPKINIRRHLQSALAAVDRLTPKAVRVLGACLEDEEQPMQLRIKCAEIIMKTAVPNSPNGLSIATGDGAQWLDVRFHWPGDEQPASNGHDTTFRVSFDRDEPPIIDVEPPKEPT